MAPLSSSPLPHLGVEDVNLGAKAILDGRIARARLWGESGQDIDAGLAECSGC
jgi:hypothetical protein